MLSKTTGIHGSFVDTMGPDYYAPHVIGLEGYLVFLSLGELS